MKYHVIDNPSIFYMSNDLSSSPTNSNVINNKISVVASSSEPDEDDPSDLSSEEYNPLSNSGSDPGQNELFNGSNSSGILNNNIKGKKKHAFPTMDSPVVVMSTSECPPNATNSSIVLLGGKGLESKVTGGAPEDRDLARQLAAAHYHSYGTALGVTIGVGCCLLLLNLLIFLAIYHQKTHK